MGKTVVFNYSIADFPPFSITKNKCEWKRTPFKNGHLFQISGCWNERVSDWKAITSRSKQQNTPFFIIGIQRSYTCTRILCMLNDEKYFSQVKPHLEYRFFCIILTTPFPWHENETAKSEQDILSGKKRSEGKKRNTRNFSTKSIHRIRVWNVLFDEMAMTVESNRTYLTEKWGYLWSDWCRFGGSRFVCFFRRHPCWQ